MALGGTGLQAQPGDVESDINSNGETANDFKQKFQVEYNPRRTIEEFTAENDPEFNQRPTGLQLFSPSKINVFLRITAKRPDGYHDLASLFHVISLGDTLKFSISPSKTRDSLTTNARNVPLDGSNLIMKALNLYREKTGADTFFWVHLDKKVPTGAGLGGGSGNAATALWAANEMCGRLATEKQLQEWSGEIGSDIPFFFSHGAAYCTGRGEIVEDLDVPIDLSMPMVLMKPPQECSTVDVYKRFKLEKASSADPRKLLRDITEKGISQALCVNDLEDPAFEVLPALKKLKQKVQAAGRGRYKAVLMSGSGSTIVGIGDSEPPPFLYDEEMYQDVFITDAYFITRGENDWYRPKEENIPMSSMGNRVDAVEAIKGVGMGPLEDLKLPFSFES
eukprot:jgi/Mesen1/1768/ME000014S01177